MLKAALAAAAASLCLASPTTLLAQAGAPQDLDFEACAGAGQQPPGWIQAGLAGYTVGCAEAQGYTGNWSSVVSSLPGHGEFGTQMQCVPAADYAGGLTIAAHLRTLGIPAGSWAGVWGRVDGPNGQVLAFDNMSDRPITGTTAWTPYSVTLSVPPTAVDVCFGYLLVGDGTAWADDFVVTPLPRAGR